ncbi:MAG: Na+/H+ antiporter NhaA [Candidatus Nanopelagicales bacterium]
MATQDHSLSVIARFNRFVTAETTGGLLLVVAAAFALIWANSPWRDSYVALTQFTFGPEPLHLDMSLTDWAADGLLAVFFFVVGVELKYELVAGSLSRVREAAVPMLAAVGGMVVPAALFVVIVIAFGESSALHGWAIPTATDIAFALAVLAIFGRGLPKALRTFLLTLAVVDDLLAIVIIACFYTESINWLALVASLVAVFLFGVAVRARKLRWWVLVPLGLVAWVFMHASGIHATIAGVLLGLTVPARIVFGEPETRTHKLDHLVRPFSSGFALPLFAFFSAGVTFIGLNTGGAGVDRAVFVAVLVGLVVGKLVGVLGTTALVTKFSGLRLPDAIGLRDLLPIGFLAGIGFTVSLLIAELSFDDGAHLVAAKVGILGGSVLAAALAACCLRWDAHKARSRDMNEDGVPDVDTELM